MKQQPAAIACTLSINDLADRRASWIAVQENLVQRVRTEAGFQLRFRRNPGLSQSLDALVAAERDCCGWAEWTLSEAGDHLILEVTGPAERIGPLAGAFGV